MQVILPSSQILVDIKPKDPITHNFSQRILDDLSLANVTGLDDTAKKLMALTSIDFNLVMNDEQRRKVLEDIGRN